MLQHSGVHRPALNDGNEQIGTRDLSERSPLVDGQWSHPPKRIASIKSRNEIAMSLRTAFVENLISRSFAKSFLCSLNDWGSTDWGTLSVSLWINQCSLIAARQLTAHLQQIPFFQSFHNPDSRRAIEPRPLTSMEKTHKSWPRPSSTTA